MEESRQVAKTKSFPNIYGGEKLNPRLKAIYQVKNRLKVSK